jgi:hypothetical protein
MVLVNVGNGVAFRFCPDLKGIGEIFFSIQDDFQRPVFVNAMERFGCHLKGAEK